MLYKRHSTFQRKEGKSCLCWRKVKLIQATYQEQLADSCCKQHSCVCPPKKSRSMTLSAWNLALSLPYLQGRELCTYLPGEKNIQLNRPQKHPSFITWKPNFSWRKNYFRIFFSAFLYTLHRQSALQFYKTAIVPTYLITATWKEALKFI